MSVQLVNAESLSYLTAMEGKVRCIFFDPPDFYLEGLRENRIEEIKHNLVIWIKEVVRLSVEKCDIFWVTIPSICWLNTIAELNIYDNHITKMFRFEWIHKHIVGDDADYHDSMKTILQIRKTEVEVNSLAISEESYKSLSGRPCAKPRLVTNNWQVSKVISTSIEWVSWCKDQIPVIIYSDIIKYSCKKNDTFLDLTAGSGTCFRAGRLHPKINIIGLEANPDLCNKIIEHHKELQVIC